MSARHDVQRDRSGRGNLQCMSQRPGKRDADAKPRERPGSYSDSNEADLARRDIGICQHLTGETRKDLSVMAWILVLGAREFLAVATA